MKIHKEGRSIILLTLGVSLLVYVAILLLTHHWTAFHYIFLVGLLLFDLAIIAFFRIPRRIFTESGSELISPADGTIVAIEQVYEKEYLKTDCMQVSIFMSGTDVHVNRYPCSGVVEYVKFRRGNYFVASYPKSSDLNERTEVGMRLGNGSKIMIRQVAGVMARRIVCYAKEGEHVKQNQEMGFIKFGSRVDLFLPLNFPINVQLQDKVKNGISPIAEIAAPNDC
ncbi:MAG: phosphatidylserine decarboxylase family protein [Bacteroidales bacterium]|nr:phosphatidylserine decarboxylase family protein [Bacteroidales bacterium]